MMVKRALSLAAALLLTAWVCGCETSDPGGGFTNGPPPNVAPENPSVRTDLPPPDIRDADLAGKGQAGSGGGNADSGKDSGGAAEPVKRPEGAAPAPAPNSP
jgi:hypothetical protein